MPPVMSPVPLATVKARHRILTGRRIAATLFLLPSVLTAAFASFIASRREAPVPAPEFVLAAPIAPRGAAEQVDITATLPTPTVPTAAPVIDPPPGEIVFSTLRVPNTPPPFPPAVVDVSIPPRGFALDASPPVIEVPVAVAAVPIEVPATHVVIASLPIDLVPPPSPTAADPLPPSRSVEQCVAEAGFTLLANPKLAAASIAPENETAAGFGVRLAEAARAQTASLVIYNARYSKIAYPAGDVSPFYGVCSDVIVRAYRSLGIDLQVEVSEAGVGSGDRNIDHRRVEVIRKFMTKRGEVLPISDNPDDYRPGDIVTYYRPQNKTSTSHIAIVSDVIGPSGQPMIVHNRGWGVQLEDALFVDKITGHYRYRPPVRGGDAVAANAKPRTPVGPTLAEPPRIRPKTPDGSSLAKAGGVQRALR